MNDRQRHQITRLALMGLLAFGFAACGGAEIGESCDEAGSTDECVDNAVCTNEDGRASCRRICAEHTDCPADHDCNGVSGTNIKSCQPEKAVK